MNPYFSKWDYESTEAATKAIASRINKMQESYEEILEIAEHFSIKVDFDLTPPEDVRMGHCKKPWVYWNPSSSQC